MNKIKFEYIDDCGYRTYVEKEYESLPNETQLGQVLSEMRLFLLACGFDPTSVGESFAM